MNKTTEARRRGRRPIINYALHMVRYLGPGRGRRRGQRPGLGLGLCLIDVRAGVSRGVWARRVGLTGMGQTAGQHPRHSCHPRRERREEAGGGPTCGHSRNTPQHEAMFQALQATLAYTETEKRLPTGAKHSTTAYTCSGTDRGRRPCRRRGHLRLSSSSSSPVLFRGEVRSQKPLPPGFTLASPVMSGQNQTGRADTGSRGANGSRRPRHARHCRRSEPEGKTNRARE